MDIEDAVSPRLIQKLHQQLEVSGFKEESNVIGFYRGVLPYGRVPHAIRMDMLKPIARTQTQQLILRTELNVPKRTQVPLWYRRSYGRVGCGYGLRMALRLGSLGDARTHGRSMHTHTDIT